MNILVIKSGKVEIRKDNGSLTRTIGNGDAVIAEFNSDQSLVAITTIKSKVEIRKDNGSLIRTIGNGDATNARWLGDCHNNEQRHDRTEKRKWIADQDNIRYWNII